LVAAIKPEDTHQVVLAASPRLSSEESYATRVVRLQGPCYLQRVPDSDWNHAWAPSLRAGTRPRFSEILPELLVGEYPLPSDAAWLHHEHGVTAILSLQDDADLSSKGLRFVDLVDAFREQSLAFHRIPVTDGDTEMLAIRLDEIVDLIGQLARGGRLYLHCNAGMNRAPTAAIAYVHVGHRMPLAAARDFVRQRRFCIPYMSVLETRYGRA